MHVLVYLIQKPVCESFVYQFLYLPNMGKQSASSIAIAGEVFLRPLQILHIFVSSDESGGKPKILVQLRWGLIPGEQFGMDLWSSRMLARKESQGADPCFLPWYWCCGWMSISQNVAAVDLPSI